MRSFKDPSLSNAVFFLDLLNAIKPGYVDYSLVNQGNSDEEKRQNGELFVEGLLVMGADDS
jgi:plastin-1